MDEDEGEMYLASPGGARSAYQGFGRSIDAIAIAGEDRGGYSSSDADAMGAILPLPRQRDRGNTNVSTFSARRPSQIEYSGPDHGSYSDFSDAAGPAARMSALSLLRRRATLHELFPAASATAPLHLRLHSNPTTHRTPDPHSNRYSSHDNNLPPTTTPRRPRTRPLPRLHPPPQIQIRRPAMEKTLDGAPLARPRPLQNRRRVHCPTHPAFPHHHRCRGD